VPYMGSPVHYQEGMTHNDTVLVETMPFADTYLPQSTPRIHSLYKIITWYLEHIRPLLNATPENVAKYEQACRARVAAHLLLYPNDSTMVPQHQLLWLPH
jgi:hypothetical protein